ncbi:MAG: hypothetical protein LW718_04150 [Sediminibacterium sp.]|nr:hypothetical protein [Sediminibacterium sp.]
MKNKGNILKAVYLPITLTLWAVLCTMTLGAQSINKDHQMPPIPAMRGLSHDYIIENEKALIGYPSMVQNLLLRDSIQAAVFENRKWIESNLALSDNQKFKWLRGFNNLLSEIQLGLKLHKIKPEEVATCIRAFTTAMHTSAKGLNMSAVIENENVSVGSILLSTGSFTDNIGYGASRDIIVLKNCQNNPGQILQILDKQGPQISSNRYADSLLVAAAFKNAEMLYNYAAAPSALGKKIQSINHPLVKWIGRLAFMKTGRYYFPFLDALYTGKMSIDAITPLIPEDQSENYFRLLVHTRTQQVQRKKEGALIIKKLGAKTTSDLLTMVYQDYFKKFIALAANYNTLQDFLSHMPQEASSHYMRSFVRDLDKAPTLEDAVDVADAFSSITDTSMQNLLLTEIRKNKNSSLYALLDELCTAFVEDNTTNNTTHTLLNNVGALSINSLKNNQQKVVIRQYFYGDKDGAQIFNAFINSFNKAGWKTTKQKYFTEVSSANGRVSMYANAPLDEKEELDLKAQDSLTAYLSEKQITPSIIVHRGHSYYANHTVASIDSSAKLVLLGSCGGYQKLAAVLKRAPETQVIASKQIGKGVINAALLSQIAETIEKGQDIVWRAVWKQMNVQLKGAAKTSFQDYIPPYKNIGLMLLKTYRAQ